MRNTAPTLEDLDGSVWPAPPPDSPYFIQRCSEARKIPLDELDAGYLRVLLAQDIGVQHVLPWAAKILEANPLVQGDYYDGDLLTAVINLPHQALASSSSLAAIRRAAERARRELQESDDELLHPEAEVLRNVESFLGTHYA